MHMDFLTLGCPLDKTLGGGIPCGTLTLVYGEAGSGKTTLALQAVASLLKDSSAKAAYIDTELGFPPQRFGQIFGRGYESALKRVTVLRPDSFLEQRATIERLSNKFSLIIVDSLVALYRLELSRESAAELNRTLAASLFRLARYAVDNRAPVIVTDQVYKNFNSGQLSIAAGDVPKYICKCIIEIEKLRGARRRTKLIKHQFMPSASVEMEVCGQGFVPAGLLGLRKARLRDSQ